MFGMNMKIKEIEDPLIAASKRKIDRLDAQKKREQIRKKEAQISKKRKSIQKDRAELLKPNSAI